jgi:hypothetical protein
LTGLEIATFGGKFTNRWTWLASPLNSTSSVSKSAAHDRFHAFQLGVGEHAMPVLRHKKPSERAWRKHNACLCVIF